MSAMIGLLGYFGGAVLSFSGLAVFVEYHVGRGKIPRDSTFEWYGWGALATLLWPILIPVIPVYYAVRALARKMREVGTARLQAEKERARLEALSVDDLTRKD